MELGTQRKRISEESNLAFEMAWLAGRTSPKRRLTLHERPNGVRTSRPVKFAHDLQGLFTTAYMLLSASSYEHHGPPEHCLADTRVRSDTDNGASAVQSRPGTSSSQRSYPVFGHLPNQREGEMSRVATNVDLVVLGSGNDRATVATNSGVACVSSRGHKEELFRRIVNLTL